MSNFQQGGAAPPSAASGSSGQRPVLPLGAMTGDETYIGERSQNLIDTFASMLERPLKLVHGPYGCTDTETFIQVPLHQYDSYLVTEHELSHCLFGTNKKMTEDFRVLAVERLLRRAGMPLTSAPAQEYKPILEKLVHHLWNLLEDHRCCGLWEQLYPGGGSLLRNRWHDIGKHDYEDDACEQNLLLYLARLSTGTDTPTAPPEFQRCKSPMRRALNLVEGVDAAACLAITGRLIDEIADELLNNNPPPEKQQAAKQKLDALKQACPPPPKPKEGEGEEEEAGGQPPKNPRRTTPKNNGLGEDDAKIPESKKKRVDAAQNILVNRLLTAKADDADEEGVSSFARLLHAGAEKMEARLEEAKQAMAMPKKSAEEQRKDVIIHAAAAARIATIFADPVKPLPSATPAAEKMRHHLEKVRMRARRRLREEGDDIDAETFIEAKVMEEDLADSRFFQQKLMESGLEILLLGDCSGSMSGHGMVLLEKAVADTVHACVGPKVAVHLWCYSDQLFVFKKVGSPVGAKNVVMSGTSMVQALEVAAEWARVSRSTRAVIHMTDGFPTTCRAKKSTGNALHDLHAVLEEMRRDRIVLTNLAIGQKQYQQVYDQGFGAGCYSLLTGARDLQTALPLAAQKLVEAHIKRGNQ